MSPLISLAIISLLGAMSPGPAFLVVTSYAVTGDRRAALLAAFGIAMALLVHVAYCALGVAFVLVQYPWLFRTVQIMGACYLAYLGIRLLLPSKQTNGEVKKITRQAFLAGFLCNILNPASTLFILSIFTQFLDLHSPLYIFPLYALIISGVPFLWYSLLVYLITNSFSMNVFSRFQKGFTKSMGVLLVILGVSVLVA